MCTLNTNVSQKIPSRSQQGVRLSVGGRNLMEKIEFYSEQAVSQPFLIPGDYNVKWRPNGKRLLFPDLRPSHFQSPFMF